MKHFIIIIFFSLFYGLTSVYAQETNTDVNKSEPETKTEQISPDLRRANQLPLAGEMPEKPPTTKEVKSPEEQHAMYGPRANEMDPARQTKLSKPVPQKTSDSKTQEPKANEDPIRENVNVKNNDYE
jgi:hypothetical protein